MRLVTTVPLPRVRPAAGSRLALLADAETFVVLALAAGTIIALLALPSIVGADTWLTLTAGHLIASTGLPAHDTLTYWTAGRRWVDQQWLAQLGAEGAMRLGGMRALAAIDLAALVMSLASLAALARVRGASSRAVAPLCFIVFLLALPFDGVRAQTFAYPLAVATLWLCFSSARTRPRRLVATLPILVVWANVHGSVLLGGALVAACAVEAAVRLRRTSCIAIAVAAIAAVFASPYATSLPSYFRRVLLDPSFGKLVTEWQAPTLRTQPVFFIVIVIAMVLVARHLRAFTVTELLALAVSALGGLMSTRNIVWFAFIVLALAPRAIEREWPDSGAPRRVRVNVAVVAAAVSFVALLCVSTFAHASLEQRYPKAAASAVQRALTATPNAHIFATEQYADWLLYRVPASRGRVAFDARFELLTGDELARIARFEQHEGVQWRAAVAGVDVLVVPRALADQLGGSRVLYRDGAVAVVRTTS